MRTGAVTDCDEIKDSECWRQFVEAGLGISHRSCKSETSCVELMRDYATAQRDEEPVERSDDTTLESGWSFVDERFNLEDITCVEGSAVPRPESECTGTADPILPCTGSADYCAAVGMMSCGGFTNVCVPNGAAVPDCSAAYAAANDGLASSCPAGCIYSGTSSLPSRCATLAVTQSKAESICRQSFGARLCTGYELWRSGTGCFPQSDVDIDGHVPVWTRTPAQEVFTAIGLMEYCPTVEEGNEDSLFVAYRGRYPEDASQKLLCLDGTQELGLVRCCADTETEECESDRTGNAYDDGSWGEAGSWNLTSIDDDFSESVDWQKTVLGGSLTLSYTLCLTWVCFLSRKYCFKRYQKLEDIKREAGELQDQEEMRMYGISQGLTGDIEDQILNQALRRRSLSSLGALRLKGLTVSPRPTESAMKRRMEENQWGNPSAGAPRGCSLSDLPDRAKILILSHTADCANLARLSVVCKWWHALHRKAARHVDIRWSQWEESDATLDAIGHVLPSYPELLSVDIVADTPTDGCRTRPDPTNPEQPILVVGTCAASAALWEYASIRSLTLRAAPLMIESWIRGDLRGRLANGGPKATGIVWHLDRNFTRAIARSKTLTSLDLRRCSFDQITGWPSSLQLLCLRQCTQMQVLPGDLHTLRSLVSLDVSQCPTLYDISVLLGASSLQWLDMSGCSKLSELSPIAGCSDLRSLNLNRCFNLREVSAVGTLVKLQTLDLSSCPLVDDISNICACETTQLGGSWCKALTRLDLSYTSVSDVACLAPVEGLDGSLFRGCPDLCTVTIRGCKAVEDDNVHELLESLPSLHVDLDLRGAVNRTGALQGHYLVDARVPKHVTDRIHDSVSSSSRSRMSDSCVAGDSDVDGDSTQGVGASALRDESSSSLDRRP
jgi:Leucine-rich repeat (LRR) protein